MNRKLKALAFAGLLLPASSMVWAQDTAPPPMAPGLFGKFAKPGGQDVFGGICQGCHMPNAMGATGAGAYPALAGNAKLAAAAYPVTMVLFGRRAMPPFAAYLSDSQVANVVNYVRSHFGNNYTDMVTTADVAKIRATEKVDEEGNVIGRK